MNSTTINKPQVPGDSTGEADDSRLRPRRVRGQMNLRVGFLNCQTTITRNARNMDSDLSITTPAEDVVPEISNSAPTTANQHARKKRAYTKGRGKVTRTTGDSRNEDENIEAVTPAEDVSQEAIATQPTTTKAGKPRVRMKWSDEMNLFIMRTYYYITKLETDRTMHCKKLHDKFRQKYPELNVSAQRIGDQRRAIIRNKLLSNETIDNIKKEVTEQINREETENIITDTFNPLPNSLESQTDQLQIPHDITNISPQASLSALSPTPHYTSTCTLASMQSPHTAVQIDANYSNNTPQSSEEPNLEVENIDALTQKLIDTLDTTLTKYTEIDPAARPKLPRLKDTKELYDYVAIFNKHIIRRYISDNTDINTIHTLIFCTALVISETLGYKTKDNNTDQQHDKRRKTYTPPWQIRIERDIKKLRADIGRLTQYIKGNRALNLIKKVEEIYKRNKIHSTHENKNSKPEEYLDTMKQKLALKSQRLTRYKKALYRKEDNKQFLNNEKAFYRTLRNGTEKIDSDIPQPEELQSYWTDIWKEQGNHNEQAEWIQDEERRWSGIKEMEFHDLTREDITEITRKLKNWKAAGIDGVHNFWYKKLFTLHDTIAKNITEIIKGHQELPKFLTKGITYMLPKSNDTKNPSQYRPITCLPTLYKLITSCITRRINIHLTQHNILSEEQKGCRQNHKGCKEQLTIDAIILKHANTNRRNLNISYIDYKKAFDSVPHTWLLKVMQIYKIDPVIISFLRNAMDEWRTTLHLSNNTTTIRTDEVPIKNGIFQGDSFSAVWFCLALNPLSNMLNNTNCGYKLTSTASLTHLLYMDDIKLFSKSQKDLKTLLEITTQFSTDINMTFGLDKCRTLHINKGKITTTSSETVEHNTFAEMEPSDTYKYLGIHQSNLINHTQIKKNLSTEYIRRLNMICKKQLHAKNLFKAINTFAIPVLTYSFGIIKWTKTDINKLEIKTRATLTKHNYLHPKSAIERISTKRQNGGRGLIDLKQLWEKQILCLRMFFYEKSTTSQIHAAIISIDDKFTPLNLLDLEKQFDSEKSQEQEKLNRWRAKELHGRHIKDLEQEHIDLEASNKWLKLGYLFPETEGFMIAIQDQVINTKNYRKHIIKDPNAQNDKCRKCHRLSETIQHITSACPTLTQTDYTHRHNQVTHVIHQKLAIKHKLINSSTKPYYQYAPQPVLENSTHKMYFDRAILTDKTIHNNRPDITLTDKLNKTVYIIDIAVPNTHNLQKTITEKIHKYTELKEEIIRIWKMEKVYIVPLVLSRALYQYC